MHIGQPVGCGEARTTFYGLAPADIDRLFALEGDCVIAVDLDREQLTATETAGQKRSITCVFTLNPFDKKLVEAGGWLAFADRNY